MFHYVLNTFEFTNGGVSFYHDCISRLHHMLTPVDELPMDILVFLYRFFQLAWNTESNWIQFNLLADFLSYPNLFTNYAQHDGASTEIIANKTHTTNLETRQAQIRKLQMAMRKRQSFKSISFIIAYCIHLSVWDSVSLDQCFPILTWMHLGPSFMHRCHFYYDNFPHIFN